MPGGWSQGRGDHDFTKNSCRCAGQKHGMGYISGCDITPTLHKAVLMKILLLVSAFFFLGVSPGLAQGIEEPYVDIRLIPQYATVEGNDSISILIEQTIDPEWHTYWTNPGDSGATPNITWTLPPGFEVGPVQWPTPHRIPYAGLVNFGYEDTATIIQEIFTPAELPAGPVTLKADIEVLVCRDICIPEFKTVEVTLNDPSATATDNAAIFNAALNESPARVDWTADYTQDKNDFVVVISNITPALWGKPKLDTVNFFPSEWGLIQNAAPLYITGYDGRSLTLRQARGDRALSEVTAFPAVLRYLQQDGSISSVEITLKPGTALATGQDVAPAPSLGLIQALVFAFLGGLILNLMPCVFPVLSIKALSLSQLRDKGHGAAIQSGILYTVGVLVSFAGVGAALLVLKAGGGNLGWGFHLQNPAVTLGLAYLLFVIGLNLSGLFDLSGSFTNAGSSLTQKKNWSGSFFTGVLATLVATPCTAPFMAGALGFALVQPAPAAMGVFLMLGLGLAMPYFLLSAIPAFAALVPRPGVWMVKFKEFLAFPLYASAAWLVWVLAQQAGAAAIMWALSGMVAIAFAIWLLLHRPTSKISRVLITIVAVAALVFAAMPLIDSRVLEIPAMGETTTDHENFTKAALDEALAGDDPVFTYMTAAWCITCKVNERVALNIAETKKLFDDQNIRVFKGDWTMMNPEITEFLKSHGRSGVPLYIYYGRRDAGTGQRPDPVILPQILTPGIVRDAVHP